jgi:GAF domain-containing protein
VSAGELLVVEQHAALRRVAVLVATGAAPADVFAAIAEEVAALFRPKLVQLYRYERDGTVTVAGSWGDGQGANPFPAGSVWPWDESPSLQAIKDRLCTGAPIRIEDVTDELSGAVVEAGLGVGMGSAVGAPVMIDGEAWGHIGVAMAAGRALPDHIEDRLAEFTELVATAISSSETREQLARLADEQAALRRVATLVAGGAPPAQLFDTVAEELGRLLDAPQAALARIDGDVVTIVASWGRLGSEVPTGSRLPLGGVNVITEIARTGRAARLDDFTRVASGALGEQAPGLRIGTVLGSPIVVAGRLWGTMTVATLEGATVPADADTRLAQFAELIATAISNTQARVELAQVAAEQAALRRVATLVAEEAPSDVLLAKVAEEIGRLLGSGIDTAIFHYEPDETASVVAVWGFRPPGGIWVGERMSLGGGGACASVYRERRPVRVDDYSAVEGEIAARVRSHGIRASVGCPILVQNRMWGAIVVGHYEPGPLPTDTERRVTQFTELVATAIANAEARAELERLAAEQAALRRVATLVAHETAPADVFDAVTYEVRELLGAAQAGLLRIESTGEATIIAMNGQDPDFVGVGLRMSMVGDSATERVVRSGRPARIDATEGHGPLIDVARRTNVDVTVGAPVTIENRVWGVITVSWRPGQQPPADVEPRLAEFA